MKKQNNALKVVLIALACVVALVAAAAIVFFVFFGKISEGGVGNLAKVFSDAPPVTDFVILGTDGDGGGDARTDFMMFGRFYAEENRLALVSIPRDTKVVIPEERLTKLREAGRPMPKNGVCKMGEVAHYGGEKLGAEMAVKQIGELLGAEIDYYIRVDLNAYKTLVDKLGGVWFDVPIRMKYDDPFQDLYIDIQPGYQLLDGEAAEGVARYRKNNNGGGYAKGDVGRAETQQALMKAIIAQAAQSGAGGITALAAAAFEHVKTDFPAADIPKYMKYAAALNDGAITTYTLPGEGMDGSPYYYIIDEKKTAALIASLDAPGAREDAPITITILNGSNTAGLAAAFRDILVKNGYTVNSIGDYNGGQENNTRILSADGKKGENLLPYFAQGAYLSKANEGEAEADEVLVILGIDEEKP